MLKQALVKIAAGVLLIAGVSANASVLNGQTVNFTYLFPSQGQTYQNLGNKVVGAGVEYTNFSYFWLDLADTTITAEHFNQNATWTATNFNGFVVRDVNNALNFNSVSLNAATNMVGLTNSRITFDAHNIYVNWNGLSFNPNTIVKLDVNSASVPETSGLALVVLGLAGLVLRRRK